MGGHELGHRTWTRWRWRLRGAVMWPAFAICLLADTILLHLLPVTGSATSAADAFVVAGFLNLAAVAVLGPLLSVGLRRRRRDLPRIVALDYCGAGALALVTAGVLVTGLVHHPAVLNSQRSFQAQSVALERYVDARAPTLRPNLARADTVRLDASLYRSCVPTADPQYALCLFIDTSRVPADVRVDPDRDPNLRYFVGRPQDFTAR